MPDLNLTTDQLPRWEDDGGCCRDTSPPENVDDPDPANIDAGIQTDIDEDVAAAEQSFEL
jgi:hypothetical protein